MSNPRFQFFLNTIPYEKQSAWTKFVQTIADLLGIKNNTAFLELLTVYDRVAQPVKPETRVARTPSQEEALAETFPPVSETAFEPGLEIGEPEPDPKLLADIKKLEAEREKAQKTKVLPKGQIYSLLSAVRGKLTISDTIDVSPDKNMRVLTAKSNGTFISELVNDGALDKWLPPDMRPDGGSYDVQESEEYIKELLRNREHAPYAVKEKLDQLNLQIRNLDDAIEQEKQLDILIRQANAELQAASEERRAEETELIAPEGEAGDTVRAEGVAARKSLAKVAPQVSEKKFQELERRAKAPAKPAPAKEESAEVKAIKEERAQKIGELQGILQKILSKYGLTDVKLNLEEGMQDQGSYNGQLIKLALDLDNPVQTLRHEAIHALKELGFFTPAQWKVLTDRAKNEWIDKYLKNQMAVVDGKEVTRYDAYMDLYKGDQDKIIEEAIADAFGDFVKTKAPPGMMQAILTRMKNLFKAIKETLNQGGYETAEDVFGKIEEGKLTKAEKLVEQVEAGAKPSLRAPITATFKRWFGDSKVVDADGNPLVMYHGTTKSQEGQAFTRFDTYGAEYGLFGIGSYFTDDPELASSYAKKGRGETPTVYPVYLSIKNPIDMDAKADAQAWIDEFQEYDIEQYHEGGNTNESWYRAAEDALKDQEFPKWEGAEIMQDKLRSMGFDGVTHLGGGRIAADGKRHRVFIAFEPEQIKSATGNIGTFEPTSPDIRKSLRAPDTKEFKQFFRESKVVDDKGEPLVVYHGTKTDLTEFDTDASELRGTLTETDLLSPLGSHFARDAQVANNFATKSGAVVYPVYLSIQNPKVYKKEQDLRDELIKQNVDSQDINDILENPDNYLDYAEGVLYQEETFESRVNRYDADPKYRETVNQAAYNYLRDTAEPEAVVDFIKQLTNSWKEQNPTVDGIIYENGAANEVRGAKTATSYIAFNPGQIKSAIGNIGTFEGTEADIRKSLRTRWSEDRVNSLLNKYAYTTDDNATQAYAAFIRPEDFLNATSSKEYRQILETERTPLDVERLAAYDQEIYLEIAQTDEEGVYEIKGHEGRHRMMALRDAGVPSVPVVLVGRPYGRIKNAQVVEEAYLKPQAFEKRRAPRGIFLWEMIPINYAEAKNLKETFGGPADIKFSLRPLPTMPTDVTDRVKQTVIFRDRPGLVDRLLDAISPRRFSQFRKEFVNRYDALASLDRQAAEQIRLMGGVQQLADAKAESAALFSDLGGGLAASAMGVHDRVGGIPVYVRKYIVEKDFKKVGPDYTTKAAAEAAARRVPGAQVFEQGYTQISNANGVKGLIAIFSDLAKYAKPDPNEPSVFDQYQFWADVKRASKYIINPQTGKYEEKLFTKDDIRRAAQIEKAFPEFVQIQKEWIKYNDGLVDFMRDTGVISEAGAKEMKKHGDYFPFYRHLGEDDIQGPRLFSSIANVKTLKKAQGSEAAVTDFFETIVRNTQSAIQAGIKNVAARRATDQAMRIKEVFKLPRADSGPSVYRVLEDGKEVYYRAQDPLFIEALKSLNQPDLPFIGLLAGPAKLLRTLVTKDPAFQLANMMRDSLSAYVSSGFKFTPIVATIKQYAATIAGKSPEFVALRNAGVIGGYDYSRGVETSAKKLEDDMRKAAKARTGMEKLASPVTSLWGALEKSSEASDAATRQEVYKRVLAETGNEAEALYQALEVMNFNRKGRSPIIRILTAAVPFMNARIQGLDVLYRSGMRPIWGADATEQEKARLKTFWVRGMTMMALSSMYWMLTSDDDDYKKQEQETRDNYWLIPSLGIKIPIPFEIGVMFKVIPERVLEYAFGDDTGKDFMKSMSRHFLSTFGFNPIPQAILPAIEITANYSFFTQRPIITQGMENISPEYQVGPNTSKVAGAVGQTLGISPIKLDHLIQGYTGTMGMYAVNLFDTIFSMNDEAPKASRRLEQMPVLRRFMVDPEARGQITAYYDFKNSVDEVVRTSNYLERSMDFEQYGKYMQENIKMFAAREYINDLEKTMKDFREMKNLIRISKMDADDKRDSLTNIGKMEQQLTQNIRTLKKQVAEQ